MSAIDLIGCTAEPLGSYLKTLGVFRLIAEQEDPEAVGWWERGGWFRIESRLDRDALTEYFLKRYRPTPILAPWNGGSGFYPKDRKIGIDAIAGSGDERFRVYREAIERARSIPEVLAGKTDAKGEEDRRTKIQLACRNGWPDGAVDWLDAAIGISSEGKRFFAPILGTGGNDGRLDYTNNFMEHVANLLLREDGGSAALLANALYGEAAEGLLPGAVGQYDPGRAGGFNQGEEVETKDVPMNPWNFVLSLEGAVAWAAGLYRRQGVAYRSFLCSPFTVAAAAVGYGSASESDTDVARAEIWAPLWDRPAEYREVKNLLREGRAAVSSKPARNGLDFAQAASMLGVDRGISGFVRYNLLMRRGKSYVALPAGRFAVSLKVREEAELIRNLRTLLEEADRRYQRDAPPWYAGARRQIDDAIYSCLLRPGVDGLRETALAVGRWVRRLLLSGRSARFKNGLSMGWIDAFSEGAEGRIAAALAGMWHPQVGDFLDHLDPSGGRHSWAGRDLAERMAATLERRILAGESEGARHNPLGSRRLASPGDAMRFLEGAARDEWIEDFLFAFTLVAWDDTRSRGRPPGEIGIWPVYGILKHVFLGGPVRADGEEVHLAADLNALAALRAGDVARAAAIAVRRLENAGLRPPDTEFAGGFDGVRLAGALLIPTPYTKAMRDLVKTGEIE